MSPWNKISANSSGSKGNLSHPRCPICGFKRCWKHGKYRRKGFHRPHAELLLTPVPVQRYLCLAPPCGATFSGLPEGVLPYCRFFLSDLFSLADTLDEGWSAYWIAKHQWDLSLRVILRASLLIQKATLWLESLCRETGATVETGFQMLVDSVRKPFSWFDFSRRWFHALYPCRAGNIFNPHNLGIKRI